MKSWLTILSFTFLIIFISCGSSDDSKNDKRNKGTVNNNLPAGKISVGATEESFDLAQRLASTYVAQNTNIIIDVLPYEPGDIKKALESGQIQIMVTGTTADVYPEYTATPIASDLILLVTNFNNPCLQNLAIRGMSLKEIQGVFCNGSLSNWNQIDKKAPSTPIKPLIGPDNASLSFITNKYLQTKVSNTVSASLTEKEMLSGIIASPGAIAFISHRKAYNFGSRFRNDGLYIIPIDVDDNNVASDEELVYDDLNRIGNAYNSGKYPKGLVRNHYFYYSQKAERLDIVKHFTDYAVKEGIKVLSSEGYYKPLK